MKTINFYFGMLLVASIVMLSSCKKSDDSTTTSPRIINLTISDIYETTAECAFRVSLVDQIQKAGLQYDTDSSLSGETKDVSTTLIGDGNISLTLTGLIGKTTYYYRAYALTVKGDSIFSSVSYFQSAPPPLDVSITKIEASFIATTFLLEITAEMAWTITSNQNWCTVQPASGDGDCEIAVSITENTTGAIRNAIVTITGSDRSLTVTIEQKPVPTINDVEHTMVFVEGGTFMMGCASEQSEDCNLEEKPSHQVTISDFYIGKYEVTQEQWQVIMGYNPSSFTGDGLPVENVSWDEVQIFITWLNNLTGKRYRLPTEAEWEFVARGGNGSTDYKYSGSNTADEVAWYWNNIPSKTIGAEGYGSQPVGTKAPNDLDIYDMSGNVVEWCSDWYGEYNADTQTDPTGPETGSARVCRGGGWVSNESGISVLYRGFVTPDLRLNYLGFRLASDAN